MDAKTLQALRGSIAKWVAIAEGTEIDRTIDNCPLCNLFFWINDKNNDKSRGCFGCPVSEHTGKDGCRSTPYSSWSHGVGAWKLAKTPRQKALAAAERDFLISLLPAGEAP